MALLAFQDGCLELIDINQAYSVRNCHLLSAPKPRVSRKQLAAEQAGTEPPLTYAELKSVLENYLKLEVLSGEDCLNDDGKKIIDCWSSPPSKDIERFISERINLTDDSASRLLHDEVIKWCSRRITSSQFIMNIFRLKRDPLTQGMGIHQQDFLDWLVLTHKLGEPLVAEKLQHWLSGIDDPQITSVVQNALCNEVIEWGCYTRPNITVHLFTELQAQLNARRLLLGSMPPRYGVTALDNLIELEEELSLRAFPESSEITLPMRSMLCEWLFHFSKTRRYALKPDTYFLGVALLDRFLWVRSVSRDEYFLYGCAALLLASKCEEMYSIPLRSITEAAVGSFSSQKLLEAEKAIAAALDFRTTTATVSLLAVTIMVNQTPVASEQQINLLNYVIASLSVHTHLGQQRQSRLAAAAVFISRIACEVPTGEPSVELLEVVRFVLEVMKRNNPDAVLGGRLWNIFAEQRHLNVSKFFSTALPKLQMQCMAYGTACEDS